MEQDQDSLFRSTNIRPEIRLWAAVTRDAFRALRYRRGHLAMARGWIEDRHNIFFDGLAEALDYEPEALRERIRRALSRKPGGLT